MSVETTEPTALDTLLSYIRQHRGFDFTGYKRPSLERRITKRMHEVKIENYQQYLDYLQVQPDEFVHLFNTILINVTRFFRDPAGWEYLADEVLPAVLAELGPEEHVRIWNPGCASGEESCTIAILLAEALGIEGCRERVKIYGTDVDEHALNEARSASYSAANLENVPDQFREKYFDSQGDRYTLNKELRRCVIYGRHDLVQDAPISRVDLLLCRNTLMYFNSDTQARILANFHFALKDHGALFLGKGEMLLSHSAHFTPIHLKHRIFRKVPSRTTRYRPPAAQNGGRATAEPSGSTEWLRDAAIETSPTPQLILDAEPCLIVANSRARAQFVISEHDLGRPFQDFQVSYDPTDLRSKIDDARIHRRSATYEDVRWTAPTGEARYLKIDVAPLFDEEGTLAGFHIALADMSQQRAIQFDLDRARQDLETAHEELESTVEEVETTNEELQSTNEELETMNEELQSTNEELETMNEELQSTNEELEAINDELRNRTQELNNVNAFLESILTSLQVGVVVVDSDLHVQIWNAGMEDLWGLRADEVIGNHFLNLEIGLPVEQLRDMIRGALSDELEAEQTTIRSTNRVGRQIDCNVSCMPLTRKDSGVVGAIMLMEAVAVSPE